MMTSLTLSRIPTLTISSISDPNPKLINPTNQTIPDSDSEPQVRKLKKGSDKLNRWSRARTVRLGRRLDRRQAQQTQTTDVVSPFQVGEKNSTLVNSGDSDDEGEMIRAAKEIYMVSDGTGWTAEHSVNAALGQFEHCLVDRGCSVNTHLFSGVNTLLKDWLPKVDGYNEAVKARVTADAKRNHATDTMVRMQGTHRKVKEDLKAAKVMVSDLMEAAKATMNTSQAAYEVKVLELERAEAKLEAESADLHTQRLANVDLMNQVKALTNANTGLTTKVAELEAQNAVIVVARDGYERQVTEELRRFVTLQGEARAHADLCARSILEWEKHAKECEARLKYLDAGLLAGIIYVLDGELVDLNAPVEPEGGFPVEMEFTEGPLVAAEQVAPGEGNVAAPVPTEGNPEEFVHVIE